VYTFSCRLENKTSISAVAERPPDALCPSVVSINSVIPRAHSFLVVTMAQDLPLRTIKCCSVVFGVTLRLLVIHIIRRLPPSTNSAAFQRLVSSTRHGLSQLSVGGVGAPRVHSTRWSHRLPQNCDYIIPHLHSTPPLGGVPVAIRFGMEKVEWFGYPTVKKV